VPDAYILDETLSDRDGKLLLQERLLFPGERPVLGRPELVSPRRKV